MSLTVEPMAAVPTYTAEDVIGEAKDQLVQAELALQDAEDHLARLRMSGVWPFAHLTADDKAALAYQARRASSRAAGIAQTAAEKLGEAARMIEAQG